jgi:hypothetical protein
MKYLGCAIFTYHEHIMPFILVVQFDCEVYDNGIFCLGYIMRHITNSGGTVIFSNVCMYSKLS